MTGVMRDSVWVFHKEQFSVVLSSSTRYPVTSSQFDHHRALDCLEHGKQSRFVGTQKLENSNLQLYFHHMRPNLEEGARTGWGVLRCVRAVLSRVMLPKASSRKLVLIFSILSGSI